MKPFKTYQCLPGEEENSRDKAEKGSIYWNEGKWENFVLPFLPEDCREQTFIDVGCNAGLYLELAKKKGFKRVYGIEPDKGAYNRAIKYKSNKPTDYKIANKTAQESIDWVPVADYTSLVNVHYYFKPDEFKKYVDKLEDKTRYCIIVTAEKKPNTKYAPSDIGGIREYFKKWEEVGVIDIPKDETKHSRHLTAICFKSRDLDRVMVNSLDNGNAQQKDFLKQLDNGLSILETDYYKRLEDYRGKTTSGQEVWDEDKLVAYMWERLNLYKKIKHDGIKTVIDVNSKDRIIDGNHRHAIVEHLGDKSIIIKRV